MDGKKELGKIRGEMQKNTKYMKSKKFQENFNFFMNFIIYSIFNNPSIINI
jgi:hypothetical protein